MNKNYSLKKNIDMVGVVLNKGMQP